MIDFSIMFLFTFMCTSKIIAQDVDWSTNILEKEYKPMEEHNQDLYVVANKVNKNKETVNLRLYYETYCPGCIELDRTQFKSVVSELNPYTDIETYPYGNAQMVEKNAEVEFICQHGPGECYGNKLHACALKHISNHTEALLFNICMMEPNNKTRGSDDTAAAKCAKEMNINLCPILQCAKSEEGIELMKYYGEESEKAYFNYVPYVLINGVEWQGNDLKHDVCAAFKNPPPIHACHQHAVGRALSPKSFCFKILPECISILMK